MRFNLKNGFVRLAVIFFVGWWLVWGPILYQAYHHMSVLMRAVQKEESLFLKERDLHGSAETTAARDFYRGTTDVAAAVRDSLIAEEPETERWLRFVERAAFGGVLAIPLVFAAGVWIWRGFAGNRSN